MRTVKRMLSSDPERGESEAERLRRQAELLREQIRRMEDQLAETRRQRNMGIPIDNTLLAGSNFEEEQENKAIRTLRNKKILVVGANGRLGSMVCRYLLRNHPSTKVVAAVHVVAENSATARGYGRLAYEVGAEDGIGRIGAAWSADDRTATFSMTDSMLREYNLQNLRIMECELLDPTQCMTVAEGCDALIWCATDFEGNSPRAVSSLNAAFLFRSVSRPDKGRVEVEGLENMLRALKTSRQEKRRRGAEGQDVKTDPVNVVHISVAPDAYFDFETPFGSFYGIKRRGEQIVKSDFPSLTYTILQMSRYDDFFVKENLDLQCEEPTHSDPNVDKSKRRITRRDAAKAAVDALLKDEWAGKTLEIWTTTSR